MSQLTAVADPSELGLDPARLAAIDAFVAEHYLDTGRYPGMSLVIARGGKVAHVSHQGYADDAIFRIYSMSKPITSVALMQLYEQGRVKLSDSVSDYLPSWADLRVWKDGSPANYTTDFPEREMIVRDLLTHTSGLTYGWMGRHPVDAHSTASPTSAAWCGGTLRRHVRCAGRGAAAVLARHPVELQRRHRRLWPPRRTRQRATARRRLQRASSSRSAWSTPASSSTCSPIRLVPNYAHPELSPFGVPPGATGQMALIDDGGNDSPNRSKPTFFSGGGGLTPHSPTTTASTRCSSTVAHSTASG
ncbi:MAG: serine hydrolase domain-containing protein [Acidimicrobiales bacterium]